MTAAFASRQPAAFGMLPYIGGVPLSAAAEPPRIRGKALMAATHEAATLRTNRLLAALPANELDRLQRSLKPVSLPFGEVLWEPDEPIQYVHFPTGGIVSLLLIMEDGFTAEVGRVGKEGVVGLPVFLGVETSNVKASVEISGEALRMPVQAFKREITRGGALEGVLRRYTQAFMSQISQLTACNTRHRIIQRLCRWLLMTRDRLGSDQFNVTQDFLAQVLGTHRPSITLAASRLQKERLIRYSRGRLAVLDGKGLEAAACECYRTIKTNFDRLLVSVRS